MEQQTNTIKELKHKCLSNREIHFLKDCPSLKGFKEVFTAQDIINNSELSQEDQIDLNIMALTRKQNINNRIKLNWKYPYMDLTY